MKKGVKWGLAAVVVGGALFAAVTAAKSGKKGVEVRAE